LVAQPYVQVKGVHIALCCKHINNFKCIRLSIVRYIVLARTAILHKRSNNLRCHAIRGRDQTLHKINIVFLNRNLDQNMPKMRYFWKKM